MGSLFTSYLYYFIIGLYFGSIHCRRYWQGLSAARGDRQIGTVQLSHSLILGFISLSYLEPLSVSPRDGLLVPALALRPPGSWQGTKNSWVSEYLRPLGSMFWTSCNFHLQYLRNLFFSFSFSIFKKSPAWISEPDFIITEVVTVHLWFLEWNWGPCLFMDFLRHSSPACCSGRSSL